MITVLHPSRERPEIAKRIYDEWLMKADKHFEYYLCIEPDQEEEYLKYFDKKDILVNDTLTAIEAINLGAKHARKVGFDILVVISDDFHCFEKWDIAIEKAMQGKENICLKTFDGIHDWLVTLPIIDVAFYDSFGYVYHPKYKHMFCDTELTTVAEYTDRIVFANYLVFKHKQLNDALNVRNNKTWEQGERIYLERYNEGFGVNKIKDISCLNHTKWLRNKGVHI